MRVLGLDGKHHQLKLKMVQPGDRRRCSEHHLLCRQLLKEVYPTTPVCEEVSIPGSTLSIDFLLPSIKLAIEVQGQQHYEKNDLFHNSALDFGKQKQRDKIKADWCDINGIQLLELKYDDRDNWKKTIQDS